MYITNVNAIVNVNILVTYILISNAFNTKSVVLNVLILYLVCMFIFIYIHMKSLM